MQQNSLLISNLKSIPYTTLKVPCSTVSNLTFSFGSLPSPSALTTGYIDAALTQHNYWFNSPLVFVFAYTLFPFPFSFPRII